jgi:hypothetical protein
LAVVLHPEEDSMGSIVRVGLHLAAMLTIYAASAVAQTPPHSGGNTPFRDREFAVDRGIRMIALYFEGCQVRIEARRHSLV